MFALGAAFSFLIALVINLMVKGTDVKYALDFAYLGGLLLALSVFWGWGWKRGW